MLTRSPEEMDDIQFVTAKMNVHLESQTYIIRHLFVPDKYTQKQQRKDGGIEEVEGVEKSSYAAQPVYPSCCPPHVGLILSLLSYSTKSNLIQSSPALPSRNAPSQAKKTNSPQRKRKEQTPRTSIDQSMSDLHIQCRSNCTPNADQLNVSWFQLSVRAVKERLQTFVVRRGRGCAGRVGIGQCWVISDTFGQWCLRELRGRGDVLLLRESWMVDGGGSHDCK